MLVAGRGTGNFRMRSGSHFQRMSSHFPGKQGFLGPQISQETAGQTQARGAGCLPGTGSLAWCGRGSPWVCRARSWGPGSGKGTDVRPRVTAVAPGEAVTCGSGLGPASV